MRLRRFAVLLLPLVAAAQNLQEFEKKVTEFTLANGLHFIIVERHEAPVVSFHTYVNAGSVDDPSGETGIAHMFEHMAFKGTESIGSKNWPEEKKAIENVDAVYDRLDAERNRGQKADPKKIGALEAEDGVHIDDHLGTAGGLWLGVCFCDRCVDGFRSYLQSLPKSELGRLGIVQPETFNYREAVRRWLAEDDKRKVPQHPLWPQWTIYQCQAAAAFMRELRALAAQTAGHTIPMGANAGLLWPRHLADYQSLDLFSAETDHQAERERFSDLPLFAYRMADAVARPYAATASGGDWAYIKQANLPGLVRGWIALSYAAGHYLMAPVRQWCYTPQKGTHWYQGPADKFAPLYQFVRQNAALFDGYDAYADIAVLLPHRSFLKDPNRWFDLSQQLASKNVAYRLLLAGDEIVDHPLTAEALNSSAALLAPDVDDLLPHDRQVLDERGKSKPAFRTAANALAAIRPAVQVEGNNRVRSLPRVKPGSAVIHLLNYAYNRSRDDVDRLSHVRVKLDLDALGLSSRSSCSFVEPGMPTRSLPISDGTVEVPELGLWGMIIL